MRAVKHVALLLLSIFDNVNAHHHGQERITLAEIRAVDEDPDSRDRAVSAHADVHRSRTAASGDGVGSTHRHDVCDSDSARPCWRSCRPPSPTVGSPSPYRSSKSSKGWVVAAPALPVAGPLDPARERPPTPSGVLLGGVSVPEVRLLFGRPPSFVAVGEPG